MGETLQDRVDEVKAWAHSRIQQCRTEEADAGPISLEARSERVALETVLSMLAPGWLARVDKLVECGGGIERRGHQVTDRRNGERPGR